MVKDGWYYCRCGKKLYKLRPDTEAKNFVKYCSKCKTEEVINIIGKQDADCTMGKGYCKITPCNQKG